MKNNEDRGNRKKKEKQLDISASNYKREFFNFLRFIALTILATFTSFLI